MDSMALLIMLNATTKRTYLMLLKVSMEIGLAAFRVLNLIHKILGIKMPMLLYSRFQRKKSLKTSNQQNLMHFALVQMIEFFFLDMEMNFGSIMTAIKTAEVIVILGKHIRLQKV
jgi:hypothetical protein